MERPGGWGLDGNRGSKSSQWEISGNARRWSIFFQKSPSPALFSPIICQTRVTEFCVCNSVHVSATYWVCVWVRVCYKLIYRAQPWEILVSRHCSWPLPLSLSLSLSVHVLRKKRKVNPHNPVMFSLLFYTAEGVIESGFSLVSFFLLFVSISLCNARTVFPLWRADWRRVFSSCHFCRKQFSTNRRAHITQTS